jgi:predicted RecA/RadA family phage recombinase
MATATKSSSGRDSLIVDYVTTAAVAVDEIVICGTNGAVSLGVARQSAAASGETISVDVGGCYTFPKVSAGVIKAGESVDWDAASDAIDDNLSTLATGDVGDVGIALADAGAGVLFVEVALKYGNTAIT